MRRGALTRGSVRGDDRGGAPSGHRAGRLRSGIRSSRHDVHVRARAQIGLPLSGSDSRPTLRGDAAPLLQRQNACEQAKAGRIVQGRLALRLRPRIRNAIRITAEARPFFNRAIQDRNYSRKSCDRCPRLKAAVYPRCVTVQRHYRAIGAGTVRLPVVTVVAVVTVVPTPIPIVVPVPTSQRKKSLVRKAQNNIAWQGFTFKGLRSWTAEAQELYCMSAGLGEKSPRSKSYFKAVREATQKQCLKHGGYGTTWGLPFFPTIRPVPLRVHRNHKRHEKKFREVMPWPSA